jgi:hypothetical protein
VGVVASPSLTAGTAGLCVSAIGFTSFGGCQTPEPYPQADIPLQAAEGGFPIPSADLPAHVARGGPIYQLVAAAGVAAVRVGDLATIRAQDAPDLPPGDKVVIFRVAAGDAAKFQVPGQFSPVNSHSSDTIVLTALNGAGRPIRAAGAAVLNRLALPLWPHVPWPTGELATGQRRACVVTGGSLDGTQDIFGVATRALTAQAAAAPSAFLVCAREWDVVGGRWFEVSVLLNARHPGTRPAPLWGATHVAGHPGVVVIRAPSRRWERDTTAGAPPIVDMRAPGIPITILARRVGDAWLTTGAVLPGPAPTLRQSLEVLASLRITRLETRRD